MDTFVSSMTLPGTAIFAIKKVTLGVARFVDVVANSTAHSRFIRIEKLECLDR